MRIHICFYDFFFQAVCQTWSSSKTSPPWCSLSILQVPTTHPLAAAPFPLAPSLASPCSEIHPNTCSAGALPLATSYALLHTILCSSFVVKHEAVVCHTAPLSLVLDSVVCS